MTAVPPPPAPARPTRVPGLALGALAEGLPVAVEGDAHPSGCTLDSRAVLAGDLYAALPGARAHGASFAAQAAEAGAVALLTDPAGAERCRATGLPVLLADDPRAVLGELAARVYSRPGDDLLLLGVTGTNGKTTTAFLLEAGLRAAGHTTGLIGTVETRVAGETLPSVRTTPEAPDLQALLAVMRERGVSAVGMEVSSHALALGRVDGLRFDVAGFTNLSQDHLDFHATLEDYEAAKALLFTSAHSREGVVNVDDAAGRRLLDRAEVPLTTFGSAGQWRAEEVELRADGSAFRLRGPDGEDVAAEVRLPGAFNVDNAVAALVVLARAGVPLEQAAAGVAALPGVPGRMERVDAGQPFLAVVDYAHTPDAVTTLLAAVRPVVLGRVIGVLGCGGDRDRGKRPLMGAALAQGCDVAVLTSDNPRSEDPEAVLREMAAGAPDAVVVVDRAEAIAHAVSLARPGDAVVVAGKGHETGQEAGGVVTPFDDRVVLREALEKVST
ncbi:MAG: UDP-N-acetylmuramoyl-L-alanyl-D-glutamate--2,6-diaminopimelate ligase [Frankiales bacterium]|nr:UDP-N-acetylmuramoyl-L-alanyl-D-glutamate--2,6-diaminopimelate ligase [Frankiales bacterium]